MAPSAEIDPRVARTRRDVLAAAREVLLEDGWERVTLARVAERSGYARTTLYRHWPQRLDLLRDLIGEEVRLLHTTPAGDLREAVTRAPLDSLMVETDSPYLTPVPYRGRRNRPALVGFVGAVIGPFACCCVMTNCWP